MWALWKKLFLEVLDKHAPVQRIRKRKSGVPWLTGEIKKIIFERDKLKREAMVTGSRAAWDKYKSTRNKVNIALRQAKTDYFRTKISNQNNNPKEAWKTINNLLGRSPGNPRADGANRRARVLIQAIYTRGNESISEV